MKTLEYRQPYKTSKTDSKKEYLPIDYKKYYSTHYSIITKFGIVLMSEMDWETNFKPEIFTYLMTAIDGKIYSAFLNKSKLSDTQRKMYATHFIKKIVNNDYARKKLSLHRI